MAAAVRQPKEVMLSLAAEGVVRVDSRRPACRPVMGGERHGCQKERCSHKTSGSRALACTSWLAASRVTANAVAAAATTAISNRNIPWRTTSPSTFRGLECRFTLSTPEFPILSVGQLRETGSWMSGRKIKAHFLGRVAAS